MIWLKVHHSLIDKSFSGFPFNVLQLVCQNPQWSAVCPLNFPVKLMRLHVKPTGLNVKLLYKTNAKHIKMSIWNLWDVLHAPSLLAKTNCDQCLASYPQLPRPPGKTSPLIPSDMCLLHYGSTSGADRFHCSLCVNFHQVCCAAYLLCPSSGSLEPSEADTQSFYFWQMPEPQCSNSAKFSTEKTGNHAPEQQHNIWLLFKIKHSMLMPAQKSLKRDKHKLFYKSFGRDHFVCNLELWSWVIMWWSQELLGLV